ncbi:MAG: hypothetical protein AAF533_24435 [Acidobacteriota bacterium]
MRALPVLLALVVVLPAQAGLNSWSSLQGPPGDVLAWELTFGPSGDLVIQRAIGGTMVTGDAGLTWSSGQFREGNLSYKYVAGGENLLFRTGRWLQFSLDGQGRGWKVSDPLGPIFDETPGISIEPRTDSLFVLQPGPVWHGSHLEPSWTQLATGWPGEEGASDSITSGLKADDSWVVYVGFRAGSNTGVHRYEETEGSWVRADGGIEGCAVRSLTVAPDDPDLVWALGLCESGGPRGLFRTVDGGTTWTHVEEFERAWLGNTVTVHPSDPSLLLVAALDGAWRSVDGGATWQLVEGVEGPQQSALFRGDGVAVVGGDSAVWWSDDDGVTWRDVTGDAGHSLVTSFDVGSVGGGGELVTLSANSGGGCRLHRLDTGRTGWETLELDGDRCRQYSVVASDPFQSRGHLVVDADDGIRRTDDGGETWGPAASGLPASFVSASLGFDMRTPGVALVRDVTTGGLHRSEDGGLSWSRVEGAAVDGLRFLALRPDVITPGRWVATVQDATWVLSLMVSEDGGASWAPGPAMPSGVSNLFKIEHVVGERLFAFEQAEEETKRAWRFDPEAGAWTELSFSGVWGRSFAEWQLSGLVSDPGDPNALILATLGLGFWRSIDGGETWCPWEAGAPGSLRTYRDGLQWNPSQPDELLAATTMGMWSLTFDPSDLLLRVSKHRDQVILDWEGSELPVTVLRGEEAWDLSQLEGCGAEAEVRDPVADDGRLYFYKLRY